MQLDAMHFSLSPTDRDWVLVAARFLISCSDAYKRISDYIFFTAVCILIYVNETISERTRDKEGSPADRALDRRGDSIAAAGWQTGRVLNNIIGIRVV